MRSVARFTGTMTMAAGAAVLAIAGAGGGVVSAGPARVAKVASFASLTRPFYKLGSFTLPPTTAQCETDFQIACYAPAQYQRAYDLIPLYNAGLTGRGRTIVLVDPFGSPTIKQDLSVFDKSFGLPAPPSLTVLQPVGKVPPYDATNSDQVGWAEETSLDVEWAHAMAPGAKIVLVETPVSETEGTVGIPQIVQAENYVINHGIGDVISQSFGATEETFPSAQALLNLRSSFKNAAAHKVSVLASSGDSGATDYHFDGTTLYTQKVNSWPSTDPLVTSVGGTQLHLDASGDRTAPDNVWNDQAIFDSPAAGGGGLSHVFSRPAYQNGVASIVGRHRGTPDVSLSAAVNGGALVYTSFKGDPTGFTVFGGTSESSPLFSGIVAIADQAAGHRLGQLNPKLYALGSGSAGIPDITSGNNTVSFTQNGYSYTVTGYTAAHGYDLASGLGTIDGARLVAALAR